MLRSLEKPAADPTYLEFFGLTRPPFARLAETSQMFQSEQYGLLMEHLVNATKHNDSRVVICGADGSGKSTLLDHYITALDDRIYFVAINETCRGAESFYSEFLSQIGFNEIVGTVAELQNITKEFLVYRGNAGDPVLLIIDNAHLIDPIILEQLRWTCEIKVEGRRVLSVVLAGNADLVRVIDAPAMSQTKFLHHVVFNIRNFTEEETASYVWHRLNLAGGNDGVKFASQAHPLIHRYSGGIPSVIDGLCDDMLTEACALKSRVITEKMVRTVADKQRLLPHVIPSHGKGRRKTDPDFRHVKEVPRTRQQAKAQDSKPKESGDKPAAKTAGMGPKDLLQHVSQLSVQVADLRADKIRALEDIAARNEDISELRNKLDSNAEEIESLTGSLAINADELAQQKQAASENVAALRDRENAANKLAALLQKERRKRELAEKELAKTAPSVDELISLRDHLASGDDAVADLESRLAKAEKENALAQRRIAALKDPEDLQEIEKFSDKLATDLEEERRTRESAETELAEVTARADEFRQLKNDLQATVADLEAEVMAAGERVVEFEVLENSAADLKEEIEAKTGELESLRDELALRDTDLANLEKQLEASHSACELAQGRILELKSPRELEEIERFSARIATDLEKEKRTRETAEKELEKTSATVEDLNALNGDLQATVDDLKAQLKAADERAAELDVLEKKTAELQGELEEKIGESQSLGDELASRDEAVADLERRLSESKKECASAQRRIAALKDPKDLQEIEKLSDQLAADLEEEKRTREAAEKELESVTAMVEELTQMTGELQATVNDLREKLETADERAIVVEALEKSTGDLKDEIEKRSGELTSLREELAVRDEALGELESLRDELASRDATVADLESRLAESQKEYESAKSRIAVLKDPEDLQEIEKLSDTLSAELEEERRANETAETELAKVTARVDELNELKEEWQSTVDDLKEELRLARERAADFDVLEKSNAALKGLVEEKSDELDSLRDRALGEPEKPRKAPRTERKPKRRTAADSKGTGDSAPKKDAKASTSGPPVYPSHVVEKFEQSIRNVRAYQTLRKYDSAFYDGLIRKYKALIAQDLTDKQVNDALRAKQARLVEKLLPRASDGAVVEYAQVIVDQLDEFDSDDTEPCFTLLIPPNDRKGALPPVYSEKTRNRELSVLEKTVRTYDADRPVPTEEDAWPNLEAIFTNLFDEYGEENVSALQNLDDPSIDRKLVCRIARTLYRAILELPKRKSVKALRWILSP